MINSGDFISTNGREYHSVRVGNSEKSLTWVTDQYAIVHLGALSGGVVHVTFSLRNTMVGRFGSDKRTWFFIHFSKRNLPKREAPADINTPFHRIATIQEEQTRYNNDLRAEEIVILQYNGCKTRQRFL